MPMVYVDEGASSPNAFTTCSELLNDDISYKGPRRSGPKQSVGNGLSSRRESVHELHVYLYVSMSQWWDYVRRVVLVTIYDPQTYYCIWIMPVVLLLVIS